MLAVRDIFVLLFILVSLAIESKGFKIFKSVETVLNETTEGPPMFNGVIELPGKLKEDPNPQGFRKDGLGSGQELLHLLNSLVSTHITSLHRGIIRGRLPFMQFLFDYEVEPDTIPMDFNLTKPNPEDESFSTAVYGCLLTPNGIEYEGKMFYTELRHMCINWNHPLLYEQLKIKPFESKDFPGESIAKAGTFCRNPDNSPAPWCFRKDNKKRENCSIPICSRKNCILTGPGIEYRGFLNTSTYGTCEPWSFDVPFENRSSAKAFSVKNFCRNPTFDPAGPYCYVHEHYHDSGAYPWLKKSYCDIPLCDLYFITPIYKGELYYRKKGPYIFCAVGKNVDYYTHYTLFSSNLTSLNISVKLWNPATVFNDQIRIALSVLAIPANSSEFLRWDIGFEIVLSNNATGVIVNPPEDSILIPMPGLLSGIRWTHFILQWDNEGLYLNTTRDEESTSIYKFKEPNLADTIRGLFQNRIQYVSVLGSPTLMRITIPNEGCEEQITTEEIFARFYPFFREGPVRKLQFAVKSSLACFLLMRGSPLNNSAPEVIVTLNGRSHSKLVLRTYENITHAGRELVQANLQKVDTVGDITLFNWTYFSLSIRGTVLRLSMHSSHGSRYLFDFKNVHFNTLRYYSIASVSVAHWTLGCPADDIETKPYLPFTGSRLECSSSINDDDYRGHISVTEKGRACLPWISDFVPHVEKIFVDQKTYQAVNYCRNVNEDYAAYCYVYDRLANRTVKKEKCLIPKCESKVCRAYGTGVGNRLNKTTTLSGRDCKYWKSADEKFRRLFHVDENASQLMKLLHDVNLSENFCRNPNNDLSGPWCSTVDPGLEADICDIPDCDRPFGTITLLSTNTKHETYIKPLWRISGWKFWVKRWERNINAGLILTLFSATKTEYFRIIFDAKETNKVLLMYVEKQAEAIEVERYAPFDFFLFIPNNWSGYHLTVKPGRLILGLVGEKFPFLNWDYSILFERILGRSPSHNFTPYFLTYEKTYDGVLAMSFDPKDPFVEILTPVEQGTYYPITYGKKESDYLPAIVITFSFRGIGNVLISFYNVISMGPVLLIEIGGGEFHDRLLSRVNVGGKDMALEINRTDGPTILQNKWTEFRMIMTEEQMTIYYDDDQFSKWKNPKPFLAYYFRLQTRGNITWITNSNPPVMDTKPINGGWSEWLNWDCSVSCGGGRGSRERLCNSPPPSLFGLPCLGEPMEYGLCNTFVCGDLPPDILEVITLRMKKYVYTKTVYQFTNTVRVDCYPDILEILQEHTPNYMIHWDRNGVAISNSTPIKDIRPKFFYWLKPIAELSDSGVYTCVVETPLAKFRPLRITSVIVKTESTYTFVAFRGENYTFHSNNKVLAWLYKDLELAWFHDGKPSDKYIETYLALMNTKTIVLEMEDTGEWECIIKHRIFKMKWHTNWARIKVRYRSDFVKYLMDDNPYTKHVFNNFEPLYVEISFGILVVIAVILSIGVGFLLVYCQRLVTRQLKELLRVIDEKLRGESPFQGVRPHSSSENESYSSDSSSSTSSEYKKHIKKQKKPTVFYLTDEHASVSDPTEHLGLKKPIKRRKILRDVPRSYKCSLHGSQGEKSHTNLNVRREPSKISSLSLSRLMMMSEEEARRDQMLHDSSSSSKSVYNNDPGPYKSHSQPIDLLNYKKSAEKMIIRKPNKTITSEINIGSNVRKKFNLNTNETNLFPPEKEQPVSSETKEYRPKSPFANFAGKSQFHREPYVPNRLYWRNLANYNSKNSEYSSDSDSYTYDSSIVLDSTD